MATVSRSAVEWDRFPGEAEQERWTDRFIWADPVPGEAEWCERYSGVPTFVARRYQRSRAARLLGMDFLDLRQLAWLGVLRAARVYNGTGTELGWSIRNAQWMIRRELSSAYDKWQRIGRAPVLVSIHGETEEEHEYFQVLLADHRAERQAKAISAAEVAVDSVSLLRSIEHHREAQILEMRLMDKRTLQECGDLLGITRERARQVQANGIARLHRMPEWRQIMGIEPKPSDATV